MTYEQLKQSFEDETAYCAIVDVVDYLETCCCDNRDINGASVILFNTLNDLVCTYLDGINLSDFAIDRIIVASADNATILSMVKSTI